MASSYELNFSVKGLGSGVRELEKYGSVARDARKATKELRDERTKLREDSRDIASRNASRAREFRPTGIYSRLEYEQSRLSQIKASGYGGTALKDQEHRVSQAQRAVDRAEEPDSHGRTAIERLASAPILPGRQSLSSIGLDASKISEMAPVVGELAEAALPFIAAATVVAGIGAVGVGLANSAAGTSRDVYAAHAYGGGTPVESERLTALGSFLGISGQGAGQLAESFGQSLQQGGYGSGFFRSQGISDQGIYTIDKSKNLLEAVDILRQIKDENQAVLVARTTGITDLLKFRNLSDETYASLRSSLSGTGSRDAAKSNAEYDAQLTILSNEWDRFKQKVGTPVASFIAGNLKGFNDLVGGEQGNGSGSSGSKNDLKTTLDNVNSTLHSVTRALDDSYQGGGREFRRSVPKAWTYGQIQEAMLRGQAAQLGDYGV